MFSIFFYLFLNMFSQAEENYLKALVQLIHFRDHGTEVGTNELALYLNVKPATVNDMLKKLRDKSLVSYVKYGKISLTNEGERAGMEVVRKHRLWETFLVEKLDFLWDEVHEVAEQLEHIKSQKLVNSLDDFLQNPKFDPHGDAIPDREGKILIPYQRHLSEVAPGKTCKVVSVKDNSISFLQYADKIGVKIGGMITVSSRENYDGQTTLTVGKTEHTVSDKFCLNIQVVCPTCKMGKDCSKNACSF
jgi:DtxR family Mn-dependent transcriptional regulator